MKNRHLVLKHHESHLPNKSVPSAVEWLCAVDLYLVGIVCSQQVGSERLQFVLGHVLECRQAATSHCLFQVHSRVAHGVHSGRSQLVTGVQDLYCRYAHHTTVQGSWKTQTGKHNLDTKKLGLNYLITWFGWTPGLYLCCHHQDTMHFYLDTNIYQAASD